MNQDMNLTLTYSWCTPFLSFFLFFLLFFLYYKHNISTGTFNNWKDSDEKFEMHRSRNDFQFITDLPRGKHMYKFIVDGEWRFAPDQETLADEQGTIQNVVDLTHFKRDLIERENIFGEGAWCFINLCVGSCQYLSI